MKKKKGFVFVETIVVTTVLTVALLVIYSTFNNVLSNEKKRLSYSDTGYMYKTFYVYRFLNSLALKTFIQSHINDSVYIYQVSCNDLTLYNNFGTGDGSHYYDTNEFQNKHIVCEKIINNETSIFNVERVYVTRYNVNTIKECTTAKGKTDPHCTSYNIVKSLENVNPGFVHYLRTLSSSNSELYNNTYRLIIEYKESELDYGNVVSTCGVGYTLEGSVCKNKQGQTRSPGCQADYVLVDNKCVRKINKYYYDSLIINPTNGGGGGGGTPTIEPIYLYRNGTLNSTYTMKTMGLRSYSGGSDVAPTISNNSRYMNIKLTSSGWSNNGGAWVTTNPIDLTNYSTLKARVRNGYVKLDANGNGINGSIILMAVKLGASYDASNGGKKDITYRVAYHSDGSYVSGAGTTNATAGEYNIDVSGLSGDYYLGIYETIVYGTSEVNIEQLWLE